MANTLTRLAEFRELLEDYKISSDTPILRGTQMVLMFGSTATGRDTIIHKLEETGRYRHLVSSTTRKPRVNNGIPERNGVEYWFRTEDEMLADLRAHHMVEAEIIHNQQISGISLAELERAYKEQKIAITNVELNIVNIVKAKPDAVSIMVIPPSFDEVLKRLKSRGELSSAEVRRRLETAVKIYQAGLDWSFLVYVVNDTVDHATKQVEAAVRGDLDASEQAQNRELVEQLLRDTSDWLER